MAKQTFMSGRARLTTVADCVVAQVSCFIADFQSAGRGKAGVRKRERQARRLEALRYSRLETCATCLANPWALDKDGMRPIRPFRASHGRVSILRPKGVGLTSL